MNQKNVIVLKFLRKIKNTLWIKCCTAFVDYQQIKLLKT
jgi:hypothetical protein